MCGFTWHPEGVEQEKGDCDIACKKRETAHTRRKLGQHSVAGFRNTAQARKKGLKEEKLEKEEKRLFFNRTSNGLHQSDAKRLLSRPQCCVELLHNELLECIEFIEWTAEMGTYRYDNYLCFSWLVDRHAPSFHILSRSDCNELRLC